MAKKFLGSVSLGGFMNKILEVIPSRELSEEDTNSILPITFTFSNAFFILSVSIPNS